MAEGSSLDLPGYIAREIVPHSEAGMALETDYSFLCLHTYRATVKYYGI